MSHSSQDNSLNGIICINKPADFTSFDVVAKVRGIARTKKVGHSGTLDPMAIGVLPVFLGNATKACDRIANHDKTYEAGFKLGLSTDTQDSTGTVISEKQSRVSLTELVDTIKKFKGEILQIPPMYSAVRVNGQRLYDLARQGKEVERKPRPITVYTLEAVEFNEANQTGILRISCSKGTYIRTLISDIGDTLSVGGCMTSLIRTQACGFSLADCVTLEELETLAANNELSGRLLEVERVFEELPSVKLSDKQSELLQNGVKLRLGQLECPKDGEIWQAKTSDGEFLGLVKPDKESGLLKIDQLFLPEKKRAIALGFFDGVHIAHQAVLEEVTTAAGMSSAVLTFTTSEEDTNADISRKDRGKTGVPLLLTDKQRRARLQKYGVKEVFMQAFSAIADMEPERFFKQILIKQYNAKLIACGYDYRFGKNARGDVALLRRLCEENGIELRVTPKLELDGRPVSSSRIRAMLADGKLEEANRLLGYEYELEGVVVRGNRIGNTLGFPTINQPIEKRMALLAFGVYDTTAFFEGISCPGVTCVGVKPTIPGEYSPVAETFLLGYSGDLYGKSVRIVFHKFRRPEMKFSSLEELKAAIAGDVENRKSAIK